MKKSQYQTILWISGLVGLLSCSSSSNDSSSDPTTNDDDTQNENTCVIEPAC